MIRLAIMTLLLGMSVALAQDMSPNGPFVVVRGTPAIGNCLQWVNQNTITDSGVAC
jgi:hypothetical protein